jgi:hypothetical protein
VLARILEEGYGPGAWHGPDFKAALADVTPALAFWRPSAARHNIAEIALHHAYYARDVRSRLAGVEAEPFVIEGQDWFAVADRSTIDWPVILETVEREQQRLADAVNRPNPAGGLNTVERMDLVLGITCHAVYHAGQVQLLKKLFAEQR